MKQTKGFTLLEILLVVAAIAILAGIVIVAINPARQLAETRDAQRRSDVNALSSAITQYTIRYGPGINDYLNSASDCSPSYDSTEFGICVTGGACAGVSLDSPLVPEFIPSIPVDPTVGGDASFSGYTAILLEDNRILVCAPATETPGATISATR
jgi:type IV pilus assembly protein PilA